MRVWTAMFLALLTLKASAADPIREVPDAFIGDWCTEPRQREEDTGESNIRIGKSEIAYYQGAARILAAAASGDALALIVQLTVDGHTRLATHEFELASRGDKLTTLRPDGELVIRRRCAPPGTPPGHSFMPNPLGGSA